MQSSFLSGGFMIRWYFRFSSPLYFSVSAWQCFLRFEVY